MLKDIKEYYITRYSYSAYVPILDQDPIYASKFLTKKDLIRSYRLLKEVFKEIKKEERLHQVLYDTIMDSKENFSWFISFFRAIEDNVGILEDERAKLPLDKCPINSGEVLNVAQPYTYCNVAGREKIYLKYYNTNVKDQIPINNYRIRYIVEDYDLNDFQDCEYPSWYILKNTIVYEQYNERTNTRVRIDFRDGQFLYFLAGASDNWEMVPDVPIEMNHFISALLFRHLD